MAAVASTAASALATLLALWFSGMRTKGTPKRSDSARFIRWSIIHSAVSAMRAGNSPILMPKKS